MTWNPNDIAPLSLGDEFAAPAAAWTQIYWGPTASVNFEAAAEEKSGTVLVTGAGLVTLGNFTERFSQLAITAGGLVVVSGSEGAARQVVVSGNGALLVSQSTARFSAPQVAGGGQVVVTGEAETGEAEGSVLVSGGGSASATGQKATSGLVLISGGGTVTVQGPASDFTFANWSTPVLREPSRRYGRVRVTGDGRAFVTAEKSVRSPGELVGAGVRIVADGVKGGRAVLRVSDGGQSNAQGERQHPAQLRHLEVALAEAA